MKIAVAGTGYVGLSIAVLLAQHHEIKAVDIVAEKVELINQKKSPIQDDYIEKYLVEKDLNLEATMDAKYAYEDAEFVVIAAPTNYDSKKNFFDTVIVDTAGRLHNKANLMRELTKIKSVMQKVIPDAPHEVLLVLDASTGQNAIEQAKQFTAATEVNALALTKLDGTAKGGVVIGISDQFKIPVKYIGVGEGIDHLQVFDRKAFVDSLFE